MCDLSQVAEPSECFLIYAMGIPTPTWRAVVNYMGLSEHYIQRTAYTWYLQSQNIYACLFFERWGTTYVEMLFTRDPHNNEFNVVHIRIYRGYPGFTFSIFPLPPLLLCFSFSLDWSPLYVCLKVFFFPLGRRWTSWDLIGSPISL